MKNIKKILSEAPIHEGLLWFLVLVLAFGFWDTFAVSFLIQFLADLPGIGGYAYLILAAIAIPAFVTQEFFIGLSRRLGKFSVIAFGLFCSGISVIGFGFTDSIVLVLLCGICNSLGYAAGM